MNMYQITQASEDIIALEITFHPFARDPYTVRFFNIKQVSDSYLELYYFDHNTCRIEMICVDADWFKSIDEKDVVVIVPERMEVDQLYKKEVQE